MKNKGFTLIELLGVIALLAIVATITVPIVIDVIQTSKTKAFEDDALSLSKAADNYYTSLTLSSSTKLPLLVTFNDKKETNKYLNNENKLCETSNDRILEYTGQNPDGGNIYIDKNGDIYLAIYSKSARKCAIKNPGEKTITFTNTPASECKLTKNPC